MYGIYGNIYHQHTPNVSIYAIHGCYGIGRHAIFRIWFLGTSWNQQMMVFPVGIAEDDSDDCLGNPLLGESIKGM